MLRLRVVRHVEAGACAVELQQRHRVQEAPRGLERSEALPRLARERGGSESEARDREQRRFNVDGVARGCEPNLGEGLPYALSDRRAFVVLVDGGLLVPFAAPQALRAERLVALAKPALCCARSSSKRAFARRSSKID